MKSSTRRSPWSRCANVSAVALVVFLGPSVTTAAAATASGAFEEIFGNSVSCAFARASVSNTSHQGWVTTSNVAGCSSPYNAPKTVPAGYIGAESRIMRNGNIYCGGAGPVYNSSTASHITVRANLIVSSSCPSGTGTYNGDGGGYRWSLGESVYKVAFAISPSLNF